MLELGVAAQQKKPDDAHKPSRAQVKPAPGIKLPTKLIISAPKKLLDQVGNGKITLAEFQKQATFEILNFNETSAPKK